VQSQDVGVGCTAAGAAANVLGARAAVRAGIPTGAAQHCRAKRTPYRRAA